MFHHLIPFYDNEVEKWCFEARLVRWLTFIWLSLGLVILFSASYPVSLTNNGNGWYIFSRQAIWIYLGLIMGKIVYRMPIKQILKFAPYGYGFVLILVLATIFGLGVNVNGAERWLSLGPIQIQPSELLKPLIVIQSAYVFGTWDRKTWWFKGFWLLIFGVSLVAILVQPNLSTTALCGMTFWLIALAAGVPLAQLFGVAILGLVMAFISVNNNEYQMKRITSFRDPWADARGDGYQLVQSIIAIGSGRLSGLGFGMSQQKLFYLPFQDTDFIFAVFGEEFGFIGAIALLLFLGTYATMGLIVVLKSSHPINKLIALGSIVMLIGQSLINMGVAVGVLPTTGVPFPMLSYGGSSVLSSILLASLLIRVAIEVEPEEAIISTYNQELSPEK
ncbi:FtsW/RodA/SpoVE family cell cycle protein [Cyanobacterium sp. IPPAS B-1200]|uniref:FtsW/RodA/SpoVE family cell cycle protein n=1 Tax=Cyanobacterium sp. IPPAS B-1200 TaxID=1562720 RepID=UPI0008524E24|nr:putative peptidoglycan glycosyltransferase FtsW [Cyanobacterium sp. IPPAS B-1200]OEJ79119.1 cell division protein FtsW [Cyanobacterium sp. IPPAS B-1200]